MPDLLNDDVSQTSTHSSAGGPVVLDETRLDTDWDSMTLLLSDMRRFAKDHPNHKFMCSDDPGFNHKPPRIPRLGWSAFLEVGSGEDEQAKHWTITFSRASRYIQDNPTLSVAEGRQKMLETLRGE